jgi:hypothetical protein
MSVSKASNPWRGWDEYFMDLSQHDRMVLDIDAYTEKLRRLSRILFAESIDVQVIESSPYSLDGEVLESKAFRDKKSLGAWLTRLPSPLFQIMYGVALQDF